jgi:VWFA-related protein
MNEDVFSAPYRFQQWIPSHEGYNPDMKVRFLAEWAGMTIVLALLLCVTLHAQSEPKFSARSELVLVPAVVTDKSGKHLANLSKYDFVVLEDGKPQKIAVFEELRTTAERIQHTSLPAGSFSNLVEAGSRPKRLVIVALDVVNTPILLQASARAELLKFLAQSLDPGEPTELVMIGRDGLTVLHDFTGDPAILAEALRRVTGTRLSLAESNAASQGPPPGDALAAVLRMLAHLENEDKARMEAFDRHAAILSTLAAFQQIAASVAGVPGRKALLWVSSGFPFSISQTDTAPALGSVIDSYQRTWRALNQAQVAVYPIDVRYLTNPKFHGVDEPGTKHLPWEPTGDDPYTDILLRDDKEQQEILTTLQNFADATGGRAFFDSNDLQRGFREAVEDNSDYYMLGYYLDRRGKKNGWHKLQVKVEQKGVVVRARNTFLLTSPTASSESGREDISVALRSPVDFSAIPIQGRWTEITVDGAQKKAGFELVLPAGFAEIVENDGNHMKVEFLAEAKAEGANPARVGQSVDVHLDAKGIEQIRSNGMTYRSALKVSPGDYNVRFVVLDALSGRIGSVSAPLKVQ